MHLKGVSLSDRLSLSHLSLTEVRERERRWGGGGRWRKTMMTVGCSGVGAGAGGWWGSKACLFDNVCWVFL
ncbi:hypothetical protein Hanom_Chr13g01219541 [Helianthus anomalus]